MTFKPDDTPAEIKPPAKYDPLVGAVKVTHFTDSMEHELEKNAWKGTWELRDVSTAIYQITYHALKLFAGAVSDTTNKPLINEFAADVGNEVLILADILDSLHPSHRTDTEWFLSSVGANIRVPELMDKLIKLFKEHSVLPPDFEVPEGYE